MNHEVESRLWECSRRFRALRALSFLIQQGEGRQVFQEDDEDRVNFSYLLEFIAEPGIKAAEEGLELAAKSTVA